MRKKTIFNLIIQFHAYGKKIWKNGNIYFTLTHEKKISWQIWFSGPNFTNEKENFSRFFFHTFTKEGNQFSWKKNPLTSTSGKMILFYFLISLNFTHDKEIWEFSIYVYFTFTCKRKNNILFNSLSHSVSHMKKKKKLPEKCGSPTIFFTQIHK